MRISKEDINALRERGWTDKEVAEYTYVHGKPPNHRLPKAEILLDIKE